MKTNNRNRLHDDAPPGETGARKSNGAGFLAPSKTNGVGKTGFDQSEEKFDLLCFSHLRWNFVFQRPQHILSRRARTSSTTGRVFYFEEPYLDNCESPWLEVTETQENVTLVVPHLPLGTIPKDAIILQKELVDDLLARQSVTKYVLWIYTPMAISFTSHLQPAAVVYDCMDELSAFKNADPEIRVREAELFNWADLVFTGGQSLYEAKKDKHPSVHLFPSSIDVAHFGTARIPQPDPLDQSQIPHPRLGFFGVLDERFDRDLLHDVATTRPDWHFVMIGPVVKIDPADLPKLPNIHYLGAKSYRELPSYIAGWEVALLLFARNESTKFISPTKTPEYLAAGKPVVSTSIRDVVRPYGEQGMVRIADSVEEFIGAVEQSMAGADDADWLSRVDKFLAKNSWDLTVRRMFALVADAARSSIQAENESFIEPLAVPSA